MNFGNNKIAFYEGVRHEGVQCSVLTRRFLEDRSRHVVSSFCLESSSKKSAGALIDL